MTLSALKSIAFGVGVAAMAASAAAAPLVPNDNNDGLPDLYDAYNILAGTAFTSNADLVPFRFADGTDQTFTIQNRDTVVIGRTASIPSTLGYYTALGVGSPRFTTGVGVGGFGFTGDGSAADPFLGATFTPDPTDMAVGFVLRNNDSGTITNFFSEASLNPNGDDHMISYRLPGPITVWGDFMGSAREVTFDRPVLIGWEDLPLDASDLDFDDHMFLVDVVPVPLPAAGWMLLSAIFGAGFLARRRNVA